MVVLILSTNNDPHATAVAQELTDMKVSWRLWDYSQFIRSTSITYDVNASNAQNRRMRFPDGETLHFEDLQSIWFRRPGKVTAKPMPEPWVEEMIINETRNTLSGILRSQKCLLVNHPGKDAESLYKLSQLDAAYEAGLLVPETLVTSEPDAARRFYDKMDGNVIYKLIAEGTNFCFPSFELPSGIPTLLCRPSDIEHFQQVSFAPHLFSAKSD